MVKRLIAIPSYPLPFGSNALSLISLVFYHDGSAHLCFRYSWVHARRGTSLGCQLFLLFIPLYGLMASRFRRDDAVTVALTERDFSLESPSWLFSYHLREIKVRTQPNGVISRMPTHP